MRVKETSFKILTQSYPISFAQIFSKYIWSMLAVSGGIGNIGAHFFGPVSNSLITGKRSGGLHKILSTMTCQGPSFFSFFRFPKIYKKSIFHHLLIAAKSYIPLTWKNVQPSSIGLWLKKVKELNLLWDLMLSLQHKREQYTKTWTLWDVYIFCGGQSHL